MLFFLTFDNYIKQRNGFQNNQIDNNQKCFLSIKSAY